MECKCLRSILRLCRVLFLTIMSELSVHDVQLLQAGKDRLPFQERETLPITDRTSPPTNLHTACTCTCTKSCYYGHSLYMG